MNTHPAPRPLHLYSQTRGFNLIELMIGMTLGLFVIGGVISVFVATQQANRTTQGLSQAQETQRIAFELLARSVREAGGNFCGKNLPTTTNIAAPEWWQDASTQLRGFVGAMPLPAAPNGPAAIFPALGGRIPGTDAFQVTSASLGEPYSIVASGPFVPPAVPPATFALNRAPIGSDLDAQSLAFACDYTQASLFGVLAKAGAVVTYAPNPALPPFILPRNQAHSYMLAPALIPATLTPFSAETWYIGASLDSANNPPTNPAARSLYRQRLVGAALVADEILENVTDMQITYSRLGLPANQAFAPASPAWTQADWDSVIAVRINLTIETPIGVNERADDTLNADANGDGVLENVATADINEHLTARRTLTQTIIVRSRAE